MKRLATGLKNVIDWLSRPPADIGAIGNADALDALGFGGALVFAGIEGSIGCDEVRSMSEPRLVDVDRRKEQV